MKKKIDHQFNVIDDIIISDEWDHVRYLIGEHLKNLELAGEVKREELPFFAHFEHEIKSKLIKKGFKKDIIDNQKRFGTVLNGLNNQGKTIYGARDSVWKYPPFAYGYPADVVILNDDKSMYWIKPDIEAALRTLESITIMKGLLLNKEAVKVYLRSFELTINLSRAGLIPKFSTEGAAFLKRQSHAGQQKSAGIQTRDDQIREHFQKAYIKNPSLTPSGFAERHADEYGLKPRQVRNILKMAVGNQPG